MITFFLLRYLHFLAIIIVVAMVLMQHLALRPSVPRSVVVRARRLNVVFAIFAAVVLVTGLGQWFGGIKPASLYSSNPVFHTKFLLFLIVAGLSMVPTIFLKKNQNGDADEIVTVPKGVIMCLRVELLLLLLMPLLASLMAYGVGSRG
tara:strand:+ start:310 stop:753 length:444 start_codon:yes stop_codon:yes gene_type:complete